MNKIKIYPSGLRLIVENIPTVRSVSTGYWVNVGSAMENSDNNGISHFTEHMMFKGTEKLSPFDIANAFESLGANVNAFTGKECTCYYVKSIDEYSEKCFSILSDIFFNSTFDDVELNKERKVIVEEINMVEDSPEDICYDLLSKTLFPSHSLGQPILGTKSNVKRFKKKDVQEFMKEFYCPSNVVIAFAGNITIEQAEIYIEKYVSPNFTTSGSSAAQAEKYQIKSDYSKRIKDFEQSNIAISYPSIKFHDKDFTAQSILNIILGGGMSSRLFQHIREELGLAYSVYTSPSAYANNGAFNIMLNITAANTSEVIKTVKSELEKLVKDGVNEEEFLRAKAQLKASYVFGGESVQTLMTSIGKLLLMTGESFDVNKKIKEINDVTMNEVNEFAKKIFVKENVCAAYVGKDIDVDILKLLKE